MKKSPMNKIHVIALACLLTLGACKTDGSLEDPANSLLGMKDETEAHEIKAAEDALASGNTKDALELFRVVHEKKPKNAKITLRYAQLLRQTGASPAMLVELAAADIALGDFNGGEKALNAVLEDQKASALHTEAYNMMGVVLDAKGQHKDAEDMYHQALAGWKGNPASVMNNLALSLANQGLFDQSLTTLRKALVIAPDKQEVARNIQIVSDLRDNIVPAAPKGVVRKVVTPKLKAKPAACSPCPPGQL
ncbi:MAG: tetratricopeptide repeat family protein [Alphaproteobacteria bacterium]|nr:tetratricopeptide repeat family protein [Alphaproteobacteria bacterium]